MARGTRKPLLMAAVTGIQITPKLYACRDAARWVLGDGYRQRMSDLGDALSDTARVSNCNVLQAATNAARGSDGLDAMQILAAAVELMEPSV